jgi:hypothetical protein
VFEVAVAGSTGATCSIVVIAALLECPVKARIQINVTSAGGVTPSLVMLLYNNVARLRQFLGEPPQRLPGFRAI